MHLGDIATEIGAGTAFLRNDPDNPSLHPPSNPRPNLPPRGFNIGARLVDDYLARTRTPRCPDLRTAADAIARVAFKQYLGAAASVSPPAPGAGPGAPVRGGGSGASGRRAAALGRRRRRGRRPAPHARQVSLLLDDTPLTDFVELPPSLSNLSYLALLAGAVRGGLDAVGIAVDAAIVRDSLRGDAVTEIRLTPKGPPAPEAYPFKDDD